MVAAVDNLEGAVDIADIVGDVLVVDVLVVGVLDTDHAVVVDRVVDMMILLVEHFGGIVHGEHAEDVAVWNHPQVVEGFEVLVPFAFWEEPWIERPLCLVL